MSDHTVTIEFEADGWPSLRFHCQAALDATCRTMCNRSECEEGCVDPDTHSREPLGYCNNVEWFSNDDEVLGSIAGTSTDVTLPVDVVWGERDILDGPVWRFAPTPLAHDVPLFTEVDQ